MIVKSTGCASAELTTVTNAGNIFSAAGGGASIVMVAVVVAPRESNTFSVTVPAVTPAGKVTTTGVPIQSPSPGPESKAFEGSLEVVI